MPKFRWSKLWLLVGALIIANIAAAAVLAQKGTRDYAEAYFFDVGQGDSIYIRTVEGNDVLIDGGPDSAVVSKLGRVMPYSDRKIELMIATHPHADHIAGLVEVLKRFKVEKVLVSELIYPTETYKRFLELLAENQSEIIRPKLGQRIFLDSQTVLDILYPVSGKFAKLPGDVNDASAVVRLSFGETNVLLTGDAGREIESFLMLNNLPLNSEILKVGHHGSKHSSENSFIKTVAPEYAVIQAGKDNNYGHPHEEVLRTLEENNLEILRNDQLGDIRFRLRPTGIEKF